METDRRTFVSQLGAGAAALSMAAGATSAFAQARRSGRKMVIRVDDVGMSKVCNIGTFDAIDGGMASSVDIMLDSPGSVDALERLRKYPWLSLGWHMHMWGAPVLGKARASSRPSRRSASATLMTAAAWWPRSGRPPWFTERRPTADQEAACPPPGNPKSPAPP